MKKILLVLTSVAVMLFATDYSAVSTQELLAIVNYTIIKKDQNSILRELKSRINEMSLKQKKEYYKNLKILKRQNAKK